MRMDLGMRSTSHYDSMPCMTVASLEMSDEPSIGVNTIIEAFTQAIQPIEMPVVKSDEKPE